MNAGIGLVSNRRSALVAMMAAATAVGANLQSTVVNVKDENIAAKIADGGTITRTALNVATADQIDTSYEFNIDPTMVKGAAGIQLVVPGHASTAGGQTTHPSVLYFKDGWNGYKYWMAHTPYQASQDSQEDPNIVASHDGTTWVFPAGIRNPIDDAPGSGNYNSDPCIAMGPNNTMYLFWRRYNQGAVGAEETIYVSTSTNGTTWTAKAIAHQSSQKVRRLLAPALLFEDGRWIMWAVEMLPSPNKLVRLETTGSTLGTAQWSAPAVCTLGALQTGKEPWHVSVRRVGSRYVGILNDTNLNYSGWDGDMNLIVSEDGLTWKTGTAIIPRFNPAGAMHDNVYHGTFVPASRDGVLGLDVWYGARNKSKNIWNIYRTWVGPAIVANNVPTGGSLFTVQARVEDMCADMGALALSVTTSTPYIAVDGFNRTDASALGTTDSGAKAWSGPFGVKGGMASPNAKVNSRAYISTGTTEQWVSAKIGGPVTSVQWWLMARFDPVTKTYYRFGFDGNALKIQTIVNGTYTGFNNSIPGYAPREDMWLGLRVATSGATNLIQCYINGEKVYESNEATIRTATAAGIQSDTTAARFDRFVIRTS